MSRNLTSKSLLLSAGKKQNKNQTKPNKTGAGKQLPQVRRKWPWPMGELWSRVRENFSCTHHFSASPICSSYIRVPGGNFLSWGLFPIFLMNTLGFHCSVHTIEALLLHFLVSLSRVFRESCHHPGERNSNSRCLPLASASGCLPVSVLPRGPPGTPALFYTPPAL